MISHWLGWRGEVLQKGVGREEMGEPPGLGGQEAGRRVEEAVITAYLCCVVIAN